MSETNLILEQFQNEFNRVSFVDNKCYSLIIKESKIEKFNPFQFYSRVNEITSKISFVCEGVFRIFHLDENGNEWNKHFFMENDFFAASSNLKIPSNTAIQALDHAIILSIPVNYLMSLSNRHKPIENFIQKLLVQVVEKEKERGLMLMSLPAPKKYEYFKKTFPNLESRIQHYHIASYLGITPTQLSRIRKK